MTRRCVATYGYMRGSSERREKRLLVGSLRGPATLSNCGESLKLQLPQPPERDGVHQGNDLGYGNNAGDWVTCSQILRALGPTDAVQRLDGGGLRRVPPQLKI